MPDPYALPRETTRPVVSRLQRRVCSQIELHHILTRLLANLLLDQHEAIPCLERQTNHVGFEHFDFEFFSQSLCVIHNGSSYADAVKLRMYENPTDFITQQRDAADDAVFRLQNPGFPLWEDTLASEILCAAYM